MTTPQQNPATGGADDCVPVVEFLGVSKSFHPPGSEPVRALRHVDLRVARHESVAIIGPSGSGKSTLLHIIGCLDTPTTGIYRLNGTNVAELTDAGRAALRGREIGFVFQQFHLLAHRSVIENVELGALYGTTTVAPKRRAERLDAAHHALARVGLTQRTNATARTLSGGEKQRVAIARAICDHPSLLLADEPTGNLDSVNTAAVLDVFDRLQADGLTLILITHDPTVAHRLQRQVAITDGQLTEQPSAAKQTRPNPEQHAPVA